MTQAASSNEKESMLDASRRLKRVMIEINHAEKSMCPICQDGIGGRAAVHLPCGHSMHLGCYKELCASGCQTREKCPTCRASFLEALPKHKRSRMIAGRRALEAEFLMDTVEQEETDETDETDSSDVEGYESNPWQSESQDEMIFAARRIRRRSAERGEPVRGSLTEQAVQLYAQRGRVRSMRRTERMRRALIQDDDESRYGMGIAQMFGEAPPPPEQPRPASLAWPVVVANLAARVEAVFIAPTMGDLFEALSIRRD